MGGGPDKAHEAFTVAPAHTATVSHPAETTTAATGSHVDPAPGQPLADKAATADHDPTTDLDGSAAATDTSPVTPVPQALAVGDMTGEAVLVGGHDIDDSVVTLVAYDSPDGPREVLYGWTTPEADAKILAALALDDEQLVAVQVETDIVGRLPLDEDNTLYEQLTTVVKSVNHHLKADDGIPAHTVTNLNNLVARLDELAESASDDEAEMLAGYRNACDAIRQRIDDPTTAAATYHDGGKVAFLQPHTMTGTATVTKMVPKPADDPPAGLLAATIRPATRIAPTLDPTTGIGSWDGTARHKAGETAGVEYAIDLGDGWTAVHRPHTLPDPTSTATSAGHRGFLEVIAPAGAGHAPEAVERLGQLHLGNRPMTAAEAEYAYLRRNVWAQRLDTDPTITAATAAAAALDDSMTELVLAERADQAHGLDDSGLTRLARTVRLEGEARALGPKTRMIGDAMAQRLGLASIDELRAQPGYDPTPHRTGGWMTFDRFDVTADPHAVNYSGKALYHRVTGNNLDQIIRNSGLLAATERRRAMGISAGVGMSETSDMISGGSRAVDLRIGKPPASKTGGPHLVWDDPHRLLRRADWYAYDGDHYAATVDEGHYSTAGQTRDPAKVAGFSSGSNEVLFRNGIDLLSEREGPDRIVCSSKTQRTKVLNALKARDITHLAGTPIDKAVTT